MKLAGMVGMNARFSATDAERRAGSLTKQHHDLAVRHFLNSGFLWLESILDRSFVEQVSQAYFSRYLPLRLAENQVSSMKVGDRRHMITLSFEAPFSSEILYANPLILSVIETLLGSSLILHSLGSVVALPGSQDQHIHVDHPRLFESEDLSASLPPYAITCVVPLVDITPETGTTAFWECSHRLPESKTERRTYDDAMMAFPRMGDVYLMDYRLKHGGTANRSERPRPILYIVYSRSWFADSVNFAKQPRMIVSSESYAKIPERHRRLFSQVPPPRGHPGCPIPEASLSGGSRT